MFLFFRVHSPVMEIPSENPLAEEVAWNYFRDIVLGMEYRKIHLHVFVMLCIIVVRWYECLID
jgi:hypothetical protein